MTDPFPPDLRERWRKLVECQPELSKIMDAQADAGAAALVRDAMVTYGSQDCCLTIGEDIDGQRFVTIQTHEGHTVSTGKGPTDLAALIAATEAVVDAKETNDA